MKQAIAIRHICFADLGSLAEVLKEQGYDYRYLEAGEDDLTQLDPLQPDLLIILGGPMGVYDRDKYPFIEHEISILQQRLAADLPTLGICLGSQMIAAALGARVYPGDQKEIGWSELILHEDPTRDYFRHLAGDKTKVLHWHGDTFDLPQQVKLLASSSLYPHQAFSYGKNTLALQFHPEVTLDAMEHWYINHSDEIANTPHINVKRLRDDSDKYGHGLIAQAKEFWQEWLASFQLSTQKI